MSKRVNLRFGPCKLCGSHAVLLRSHCMPKGAFRALVTAQEDESSIPVLLDYQNDIVIRKNEQPQSYALCADCEYKFKSKGEDTVLRECYRGIDRFKLRRKLKQLGPSGRNSGENYYAGQTIIGTVDAGAYAYFALSILWRGSEIYWGRTYEPYNGSLGQTYAEKIKQYLLGVSDLPDNIQIHVEVDFDEYSLMGIQMPRLSEVEEDSYRQPVHTFAIPGFRFVVVVGGSKRLHAEIKRAGWGRVAFWEWSYRSSDSAKFLIQAYRGMTPRGNLPIY